ncbi:hypothetical protein H9J45_001720 [Escherichia coli]|nr:hypothetical protein [Escherichia coli]
MATKYYALLTNVGAAKLANATALGEQVEITQMAVGDGNGALPTPNPAQTALVHELRRAPLNTLTIDPVNTNQIIAEQVIPEDVGGWWIREIGLYDSDGDMIAVANCAETYKPLLQEGSGRMQVIRVILIVSSTQAVTLKIDPSVVLATRQYVDDQIIQVKAFVDQQLAAHIAAADPHKQYAPKASPALTGTPTAPTAAQTVNNTQIATTGFVKSAIAALVASSPAALDTLNELAAALGNDPNFATTVTNALAGKQPLDSTLTNLSGKTVNGILQYLGLGDALIGDECKIAGFDSSNVNAPYMRFARTNTVVRLATKDYAQPKDQTLTDLSGKDKAELRTYLDLKSAAQRDVGSGANQIPDMNDFTSSLTSPGWQKLPSGLIIQWGAANPSSTGEIFITFPVAFSAYPMYVGFGPQQVSLPNVVQSPVISAPTITNLGCGVRNLMIPTAGGAPVASMSSFFWIAVGK